MEHLKMPWPVGDCAKSHAWSARLRVASHIRVGNGLSRSCQPKWPLAKSGCCSSSEALVRLDLAVNLCEASRSVNCRLDRSPVRGTTKVARRSCRVYQRRPHDDDDDDDDCREYGLLSVRSGLMPCCWRRRQLRCSWTCSPCRLLMTLIHHLRPLFALSDRSRTKDMGNMAPHELQSSWMHVSCE